MSRSNPHKLKRRSTRATAQIVVEGYTEAAFCKHLKSCYARDCGVAVEIHNARGGSPQDLVKTALQRSGFDRTFLFFDADVRLPETWATKARGAGHVIVTTSPCVEAFLLALLGQPRTGDTAACKRALDAILPPPGKYDPKNYARLYPKELLDASQHPTLMVLRSAFTVPS
ncbi:MAG: hypothetical protein MUF31_05485 [Akkermansiaceae bacterium]|nr:hypothetical protein [Akkermansiaceae bacterium]